MKKFFSFIIVSLLFIACTGDDSLEEATAGRVDTHSSLNQKMNVWAYQQMRHHYLWNEELPDSASLDFESDFDDFFKSLKSVKDKFSYYKYNTNYEGTELLEFRPEEMGVSGTPSPLGDMKKWKDNVIWETRAISELQEVLIDTIYDIGERRIGYINYTSFGKADKLYPPFRKFKQSGITDLIVDLRYNGGGLLNTSIQLCSMILPDEYIDKDAVYLKYNDNVTAEMKESDGVEYVTYSFSGDGLIEDMRVKLDKVYFIVGNQTASASESTINSLRPYIDVVTIGTRTVGKGTGMYSIKDDRYRYELVPITFRYYNKLWESIPDDGLVPDYDMSEYPTANRDDIGKISEPCLHKAMQLILGDEFETSTAIN